MGRGTWSLGVFALVLLTACGSADEGSSEADPAAGGSGGEPAEATVVELFSWWTKTGEAEALQALIDVHRRAHRDVRIFNAAAENAEAARTLLSERFVQGLPPDLYQENGHELSTHVTAHPDRFAPLDDLYDQLDLRAVVVPEVLRDVTVGGTVSAMPAALHRENTLFYNVTVLATHGLTAPRTLPELLSSCATLKAAGVTPLALGNQMWMHRILWNMVAMGSMGPAQYQAYHSGGAVDDAALARAVSVFADLVDNYSNAREVSASYGWTDASQDLFDGNVALFPHGDWVKGYLMQLGWTPGVDFGVVGAPSASEVFLYSLDVFAVPGGARHAEQARDFLATIASPEAQLTFNEFKGSSPIRLDVSSEGLDPVSSSTLEDLKNAEYRLASLADEDYQLGQFYSHKDQAALVLALKTISDKRSP